MTVFSELFIRSAAGVFLLNFYSFPVHPILFWGLNTDFCRDFCHLYTLGLWLILLQLFHIQSKLKSSESTIISWILSLLDGCLLLTIQGFYI